MATSLTGPESITLVRKTRPTKSGVTCTYLDLTTLAFKAEVTVSIKTDFGNWDLYLPSARDVLASLGSRTRFSHGRQY